MESREPVRQLVPLNCCPQREKRREIEIKPQSVRLLVVDDHPVVRGGVIALLRSKTGFEIVGEAETAKEAIDRATLFKPDIVLLDVHLRGEYALGAARKIVQTCPATRVIAFSVSADPVHVRGMLAAGALGYVLKASNFTLVLFAIRAALSGARFLDPSLSCVLIEELSIFPSVGRGSHDVLTPRENEVLKGVILGYTNREISVELGITISSVNTYRIRLCDKLGLTGRAEMVRYGVAVGLMPPIVSSKTLLGQPRSWTSLCRTEGGGCKALRREIAGVPTPRTGHPCGIGLNTPLDTTTFERLSGVSNLDDTESKFADAAPKSYSGK